MAAGALDVASYDVDLTETLSPSAQPIADLLDDRRPPGTLAARITLSCALGLVDDPRVGYEDDRHMALVSAGPFVFDSVDEEAYSDEKPAREVTVSAFRIARPPVTARQHLAFIEAGGYDTPAFWPHGGRERDDLGALVERLRARPSEPATSVSWFEAVAFCEWLNVALPRADGWSWRLPTEAEWEKAARGGLETQPEREDVRVYPWPGAWRPDHAQHAESEPGGRAPIGCHAAGQGPYGAHDQAGNVFEWCLDGRADGSEDIAHVDPWQYDAAQAIDPESFRVLRGGSFDFGPRHLRLSCRLGFGARVRDGSIGFRVVCSALPRTLGPRPLE